MSKRPRRHHSLAFKVKVAVAAVKGEKTLAELTQIYNVHAPSRCARNEHGIVATSR